MTVGVTGLTARQHAVKRSFDVVVSAVTLLLVGWLVPVMAWLARRDTGASGIFRQQRIGRHGEPFDLFKIRTMVVTDGPQTTVTVRDDPRITAFGSRLRRWKLDEIPQLWNVLRGDMSFVGPRPDVPGYYDQLRGDDRVLLTVRPGITSPAAVRYRNEEALLAEQDNPQAYNDEILFAAKVAENRRWLADWSLWADIGCLARTVILIMGSFVGRAADPPPSRPM